ncbi:MAG TPA: UvrB/UvrC motif-containing protein [Phycisphaerae bacterium]|nr:UvrB/UvrC motif-containing protein [Phycisphaerae bacterium]HNU46819.1 UvrB/UvrC motif-containing protein [Phycisphaerae bacterium]
MHLVCQRCKKARATVHITDTFPQKREWHLCEECAGEEGIIRKQEDEAFLEKTQSTTALLQEFLKHKSAGSKLDNVTCEHCGITFREFKQQGLLGCPQDYTTFREMLTALVERAHEGATQHVGKVPVRADTTTQKRLTLTRLRRELQEALKCENYELAARVRDQISELESV